MTEVEELREIALNKALETAHSFELDKMHGMAVYDLVVDGASKYYHFLIRGNASLTQREKQVAMETLAEIYPKATDEEIYEIYGMNKGVIALQEKLARAER